MTAGIYKIQRVGTDQCYVGSSVIVRKRWTAHRRTLSSGTHHAPRLQNAWAKHGSDAFEFVLLEECAGEGQELKALLVAREQAWMDRLKPCFNTVPAAGSTLGFKMPREIVERHRLKLLGRKAKPDEAERLRTLALGAERSEETKAKLRAAGLRRGMPRTAIDNSAASRRGKRLTPEHIEKVRQTSVGRRHRPEVLAARSANLSPEIRERMGAHFRGRTQSPEHVAKKTAAIRAYHQRRRDAAAP